MQKSKNRVEIKIPNGLNPVYCNSCRAFIGYEFIRKGYSIILCKKCKAWNILIGRNTDIEKVKSKVDKFLDDLYKIKNS